MILLLVASGRGVAVLPDWVVRSAARADMELVTRPLLRDGRPVLKRLYAATREAEATRPFVAHLVRLARQEAVKLQRG
jgi:LysR family transcriptional regulator for metE and metH